MIPKCFSPDGPAECRNISCTNFLSKVFEGFVLEWARKEVRPKDNQFGGEKGCSTTHLLVATIDEITEALEDRRTACVLTAIDFSKAFNRLEHGPCLEAFKQKGASKQIIGLLAAFMTGRQMTVRVGNSWSQMRPVHAGAPQGSVLGSYLFNIGTDDLEEDCRFPDMPFFDECEEATNASCDFPAASTPTRVSSNVPEPSLSPMPQIGRDIELGPRVANVPPWLRTPKEKRWEDREPTVKKFIDDGINIDVVNMLAVQTTLEKNKPVKTVHPVKTQALLEHVTKRANQKGMVVNDKKTTIMCVSAATSYEARARVTDRNGENISSNRSMKVLGCVLDSDCTMKGQAESVRKKLRSRTWGLAALKKNGFTDDELIRVYKSQMRPVAEYSSVAWHSLLTREQSENIERQQSQALKHIYGYKMSARKMRAKAGLDRLEDRREAACLKFAKKCSTGDRFGAWFERNVTGTRDRRSVGNYKDYVQPRARTDRHNNSPLNYCRRLLNK